MIEAIIDFATGVVAVTVTLMIFTFPAWLAGKIVAAQTRTLPVPFFLRLRPLRWASWYVTGIVALTGIVLALRPTGTFESSTRLALIMISLTAYAAAVVSAFYLSWTASAQRRSRKAQDRSDPMPLAQGWSGTTDAHKAVAPKHEDANPYAAPQPHGGSLPAGNGDGDAEYKPARPAE